MEGEEGFPGPPMEIAPSSIIRARIWISAAVTILVAAALVQIGDAVQAGHVHWNLDKFRQMGIIAALGLAIFVTVVPWAAGAPAGSKRTAATGLVCGILGLASIVVFFLSAPVLLGGAGITLGWESFRRSSRGGGRGLASAAIGAGGLAVATGSAIWLFA